MFMTDRFPFKYGRFVCTACQEVVSWYLTTTDRHIFPDKTVTVWNKTGNITDKP